MNTVKWFEVPATDLKRAQKFYETVLEYKMKFQDNGYSQMVFFPYETEEQGGAGAIVKSPDHNPGALGVVLQFEIEDVSKALSQTEKNGGKIIKAKTSAGQYGFVAWILDSEGNKIKIHSMK